MFYGTDPRGKPPTVVETRTVMIGPNEVAIEEEHRGFFEPQPGAPMFDYMIDLETTGVNSEENAIIQLAAVRFNLDTKEIDTKVFNGCMTLPVGRYWDEGTREWHMHPDREKTLIWILQNSEDPAIVMRRFFDWVTDGSAICPKVFWAKPTTFDYTFVASYFRQFGLMMPFHYREANDLNSYIRGRGHRDVNKFWKGIEPVGDAHNALHDCFYQIKGLFNA